MKKVLFLGCLATTIAQGMGRDAMQDPDLLPQFCEDVGMWVIPVSAYPGLPARQASPGFASHLQDGTTTTSAHPELVEGRPTPTTPGMLKALHDAVSRPPTKGPL